MIYKLKYTPVFAVLLAMLFISSCRTEPSNESSNTTDKSPSSLQVRLISQPDGLSPILARRGVSRQVYRHLYTRLLEVDPKTSDYVPQLAVSMPVDETLENGHHKITFSIHPSAMWSDNTPLTTEDILFSYKLLKHPGIQTRYGVILDAVNNIQIDPSKANTITFTTNECQITLVNTLCEMYIYPEHIFDPEKTMRAIPFTTFLDKEKITAQVEDNNALAKVGERFMNPAYYRDASKFVTSSAYTFKEWLAGQRITIQKNKDWWGNKIDAPIFKPKAEQIEFQIIPDNNTAATQLINGELDAIVNIPAVLYDEYKNNESVQAKESSAYVTVWLALNNEKGLLSDRLVRLALSHICDTESIVKNALNNHAAPVTGPFMPGTEMYNNEVPPIPFDVEKARDLLRTIGWTDSDKDGILDKVIDGKKTNLSLKFALSNNSTTGPIIAEIIKNNAKQAGIDIQIEPGDDKSIIQMVRAGDFDIFLTGTSFGSGLYDPTGRWHTKSFPPNGGNYCRYGNTETDAIIDQIKNSCENDAELINAYHRLHASIAADQPVIFLYNPKVLFLINKKFDNVVVSPDRPGLFEEYLTLN